MLITSLAVTPEAYAQGTTERVALVIGAGAYQNGDSLPGVAEGARALADGLEEAGFHVFRSIDQDVGSMITTVDAFYDALSEASLALFYFGGHSVQYDHINYLLPVDVDLSDEMDLQTQTLRLDDVLDSIDSRVPVRLAILDAGRDSPFAQRMAQSLGMLSPLVRRGLAEIEPRANTFIIYSTQPDTRAIAGGEGPSPFTDALVAYLSEPGLELRGLMTRVRRHVYQATRGEQLPWEMSALLVDVYLVPELPGQQQDSAAEVRQHMDNRPLPTVEAEAELVFWQSVEAWGRREDYEAYMDAYASGRFTALARERVAALAAAPESEPEAVPAAAAAPREVELALWNSAESYGTADAYETYLNVFPAGQFADQARIRLEAIDAENEAIARQERQDEAMARAGEIPSVALQWALRGLGFYTSRVDGAFGPQTQAAVRAFQETIGAGLTGELTPEQRVRLIEMAAEDGQPESQTTLGIMYASGIGYPADPAAARHWFEEAAGQGFEPAQANLERMEE
ncbi:MAG: caspase family protein [Rhodospirillaceae bacterium]|nr:caspase family protein [Rhodospirillaceae bacterium]